MLRNPWIEVCKSVSFVSLLLRLRRFVLPNRLPYCPGKMNLESQADRRSSIFSKIAKDRDVNGVEKSLPPFISVPGVVIRIGDASRSI